MPRKRKSLKTGCFSVQMLRNREMSNFGGYVLSVQDEVLALDGDKVVIPLHDGCRDGRGARRDTQRK